MEITERKCFIAFIVILSNCLFSECALILLVQTGYRYSRKNKIKLIFNCDIVCLFFYLHTAENSPGPWQQKLPLCCFPLIDFYFSYTSYAWKILALTFWVDGFHSPNKIDLPERWPAGDPWFCFLMVAQSPPPSTKSTQEWSDMSGD